MLKIKSNTNEFTIIFSEKIGKKKNAQKISFSLYSVQHPFFFSPSFLLISASVRTRFNLNPEQEQIQAHKGQTINLQSAGEKASLNLGQRYWIIALEGKSYTHISVQKKSSDVPLYNDLRILESFLFFSFFFLPFPFFFSIFVLYTMAFLPFSPSTCGSGVESPFSPLLLSFLESSILSCKAACSLFRHHLHINAARRLTGQHLMRR